MVIRVDLAIFDLAVFFFIGEEEKKNFLKQTGKDANVLVDCDGFNSFNAVWLANMKRIGVIVHESHHVTSTMCDILGIKDEETEAYIIGYLVNELLKKYTKKSEKTTNLDTSG